MPHHLPRFRRQCVQASLLIMLTAGSAAAQPRHMEATGASLAIDSPCARSVTIQPDAGLTQKYTLDATAAHPEELAQLRFDSGATAKLRGALSECWGEDDGSFTRTLDITLRVPLHAAMAIEESGGSKYVISDVDGNLTLDVSGGVAMQIGGTADLTLDVSGGGDITVSRIDGSVKAEISGGGSVRIGQAAIQDLTLSLSGGGDFVLDKGTVRTLTFDVSGSGNVKIGATAGDATVDVSGSGSVEFAKITGALTKEVDGSGSVTVGASP